MIYLAVVVILIAAATAQAGDFCNKDVQVFNGDVDKSESPMFTVGTSRAINCSRNFISLGSPYAVCGTNGWSVLGICISRASFRCPKLSDTSVPNGVFLTPEWVDTKWMVKRSFGCKSGYRLRGSNILECDENRAARWLTKGYCEVIDSGPLVGKFIPQCSDSALTSIAYAEFSGNSILAPAGYFTRFFRCMPGFFFVGSSQTALCNPNERRPGYSGWKLLGTCQSEQVAMPFPDCDEPDVDYANIHAGRSAFSSRRTFKCAKGFYLTGVNEMICTLNGAWFTAGGCQPENGTVVNATEWELKKKEILSRRSTTTVRPTTLKVNLTSKFTNVSITTLRLRRTTIVRRLKTTTAPATTTHNSSNQTIPSKVRSLAFNVSLTVTTVRTPVSTRSKPRGRVTTTKVTKPRITTATRVDTTTDAQQKTSTVAVTRSITTRLRSPVRTTKLARKTTKTAQTTQLVTEVAETSAQPTTTAKHTTAIQSTTTKRSELNFPKSTKSKLKLTTTRSRAGRRRVPTTTKPNFTTSAAQTTRNTSFVTAQSSLQSTSTVKHTTAIQNTTMENVTTAVRISRPFQNGTFRSNVTRPGRLLVPGPTTVKPPVCICGKNNSKQLVLAAGRGEVSRVKSLLAKGFSYDSVDNSNQTALLLASRKGHISVVKAILTCMECIQKVDAKTRDGTTALIFLAQLNGSAILADKLIAKGADIDAVNKKGITALHVAVRSNNLAFVRILLANDADPDVVDFLGDSPLMLAVKNNSFEAVKVLLASGVDVNLSNNGTTPLMEAARMGYSEIVQVLIRQPNIDLEKLDRSGNGAEMIAFANGNMATGLMIQERRLSLQLAKS